MAEGRAREFAEAEGAAYISPYNHPDVIAGAGTVGLDLVEAMPSFDVVVVPLGGGGLASGVGLAVKAAAPRVTVVGVEVEASTPFTLSLEAGRITAITPRSSLADGLTGNLESGSITFPLVKQVVDYVVTVSEDDLVARDARAGRRRTPHRGRRGRGGDGGHHRRQGLRAGPAGDCPRDRRQRRHAAVVVCGQLMDKPKVCPHLPKGLSPPA